MRNKVYTLKCYFPWKSSESWTEFVIHVHDRCHCLRLCVRNDDRRLAYGFLFKYLQRFFRTITDCDSSWYVNVSDGFFLNHLKCAHNFSIIDFHVIRVNKIVFNVRFRFVVTAELMAYDTDVSRQPPRKYRTIIRFIVCSITTTSNPIKSVGSSRSVDYPDGRITPRK